MEHEPPASGWSLPDHLDGRALVAARAVWLVVVACLVALASVGFVRAAVDPTPMAIPALTEVFDELGLDLRLMAAVALLLPWSTVLAVSLVVFWRRSRDPMALLFTLTILLLYTYVSRTLLYHNGPVLGHALSVVFAGGLIGMTLVFALFPDGRLLPRWARWLPVAAVAMLVAVPDAGAVMMGLLDGQPDPGAREVAFLGAWTASILVGLLAQRARARITRDPTVRQQQKWVVFPFGVGSLYILLMLVVTALPGAADRVMGWMLLVAVPLGVALPLAFGNAVLRHRLYDIDRVISRTITYAVLAVCLGGVYAAGVVGLGALVASVSPGDGGQLPVAVSTLAVIALFGPLRRRVQAAMDRRFFRTHALALHEVEAFTHRLRDEVDVDAAVGELRAAASAAVAPASASVWLRSEPSSRLRP
jgi:hypothetical protein